MEKNISIIKNILVVFLIIVVLYMLSLLSFIFVPFVLALFFTLLLIPILDWLHKHKVPYLVGSILSFLLVGALVKGILETMQYTWGKMLENQDVLKEQFNTKLEPIVSQMDNWFGVSEYQDKEVGIQGLQEILSPSFIANTSGQFVEGLLGSISSLVVFLIFLLVILSSLPRLNQYLSRLAGEGDSKNFIDSFQKIKKSLTLYVKVKLTSSLITGASFGLITWMLGVDFPFFWGFMAFVLNFVQYIGSIAVTIVVILFGFLQIDSMVFFGLYVTLLIGVQIVIGNIVEPSLMGRSFSINTISVIIGVMLWGYVWGIAGLVLAVPLMVVIKMILSHSSNDYLISRIISRSVDN